MAGTALLQHRFSNLFKEDAMNKKLIALAVAAAALAPAAFAGDNEVVLYGQVNIGIQSTTSQSEAVVFGNAAPGQLRVENLSSRIGFKGEEALGGGMKAYFKVETGFKADEPSAGGTGSTSSRFGSREAWVGLKGDFGQVGLGRGKSPYTNATEEFDPFYQDASLGLTANTLSQYRQNNSIRYDYSSGPVSFAISNSFGEDKSSANSASNEVSAMFKYNAGAFSVVAGYNGKKPGGMSNQQSVLLGGTATLGDLSLSLAAQNRDQLVNAGGSTKKVTDALFLATYGMGDLSLNAGLIAWDKNTGKTVDAHGNWVGTNAKTQLNLGAFYNLSKRTVVTAEYTENYGGTKNANVFSLALNHSF
jgi:predicted porin